MESMIVSWRVDFVHHSRVAWVVLESEDSPSGLSESRWVAHGMGSALGGEVNSVNLYMVEL